MLKQEYFRLPVAALWCCSLLVLLIALEISSAHAIDWNGDGVSELGLVQVDSDGKLDWSIVVLDGVTASTLTERANFGANGHHTVPGRYLGSNVQLAHVAKNQKAVEWTVVDADNNRRTTTFGKSSQVVGVGDLNADALTDLFTMTTRGKVSFRLNPFGAGNAEGSIKFPARAAKNIKKGSRVGLLRSGDGSFDLSIMYKNRVRSTRQKRTRATRYVIVRRDENGNGYTLRLPGIPNGSIQSYASFQLSDGSDGIVLIEKPGKKRVRVRIFDISDTDATTAMLLFSNTYTGTTGVIGKYLPDVPGEQFGVKNGSVLTLVSPFQGAVATDIEIGDGVIIDQYNINFFGRGGSSSGSNGGSSGGGETGGGGNTGATNPGLSRVCNSIASFGPGRLWKPDSDVADNRGGKPVLLLTGGSKGDRSGKTVYDSKGNVICSALTYKSGTPGINNGADHFYSGWVGGCSLSGGQMAAKARANTGSVNVYLKWKNGQCLNVGNPDERHGSI